MRRLLLLIALIPASVSGQAGTIAFEQFTLPNGLHVVYSEDHSTPLVTVDLWYDVGSRNERAGRSGFAHLFEHMMFQGSAHVKKTEHGQLIERAGGTYNGSTAEDRTNYYQTLPSNRLNLALWLEADRMRSLAITTDNFENQRQAVKEERRLRVDNQPYAAAFTDGLTWPFDSSGCFPYAHTVIGSMADLDAAKLPDVQAFFEGYWKLETGNRPIRFGEKDTRESLLDLAGRTEKATFPAVVTPSRAEEFGECAQLVSGDAWIGVFQQLAGRLDVYDRSGAPIGSLDLVRAGLPWARAVAARDLFLGVGLNTSLTTLRLDLGRCGPVPNPAP